MSNTKDKEWLEKYELAKQYYKEKGNLLVPNRYVTSDGINLGYWIQHQREDYKKGELSQERIKLLETIDMVWDASPNLDAIWLEKYELAKKYFEKNNNLLIPQNYETKDSIRLGHWISTQRTNYRKGILSQEKINKLESIGMIWNPLEVQWFINFELAKEYFNENNHLLVPLRYQTNNGINLGNWIRRQRDTFKNNKLSQDKIDLLNNIDMIWDASLINGTSFPEYLIYYYFKNIHGEDKVFYRYNFLGFELDVYISNLNLAIEYDGQWHKDKKEQDEEKNELCKQNDITLYRFREEGLPILKENNNVKIIYINKGPTDKELYNKIIEIFKYNIKFDIKIIYNEYALLTLDYLDSKWQKYYNLAKEYFKENGNLLIPLRYQTKNNINLGNWIRKQRDAFKNNKLSQERIDLLESIGMVWNLLETQWQEAYELAKEYYEENHNLLIPCSYEINGFKLGNWIQIQRKCYKEGTNPLFTKEKIFLLEEIDMIWDVLRYQWQEYFNLAKEYFDKNNDLLIPKNYQINSINLGYWIQHQRQAFKKGELSQNEIDLLDSINMVWDTYEAYWLECYSLAKQYYKENNNLLISQNYKIKDIQLGQWISKQRQAFKKEELSQKRIDLLESIGMAWNTYENYWLEAYELAKEYYEENNNLLIPKEYEINNIKLGQWIYEQRRKYKNTILVENKRDKKRGILSEKQIKLLESIGMVWSIK